MKTYTGEEIVKILHSIRKVELDSGHDLDTWFNDPPPGHEETPSSINSFTPGTFTFDLLNLIHGHMYGNPLGDE